MNASQQYKVTINRLPQSEVEIQLEIPWEELETKRKEALSILSKDVEIKGFRKGAVPENLVIAHLGDMKILFEQAQLALADVYPKIIEEEKLDTIGRPNISITKIAPQNPLGVTIKTALAPEITLPDYKKIAKEVNKNEESTEVTDADVEHTIEHLREQWAKSEKYEQMVKEAGKDTTVNPADVTVEKSDYPEFNDDFVKKLGNFDTVPDFKTKLRENMDQEKKMKVQEKNRLALLEKILEETTADIPDIVIDAELAKMLAQFEDDVKKAGFKLEEYLKQTGKTVEDLKKEWKIDAEKRAKTQLILNKIAEEEKLLPEEKRIEEETAKVLRTYKDADPLRARIYIATVLSNEKVIEFLESQK